MDAIECLLTRRSCRSFSTKEVEKEKLDTILKCATYAPSGKNMQSWHFIVVSNQEVLNEISNFIRQELQFPNYNVTYGAPILIVVTDAKDSYLSDHNGACALENIFLAAHAQGLSSCWINQLSYQSVRETKGYDKILKLLKVPETDKIIGCAAIGYGENAPLRPRKEDTIIYIK